MGAKLVALVADGPIRHDNKCINPGDSFSIEQSYADSLIEAGAAHKAKETAEEQKAREDAAAFALAAAGLTPADPAA